jgi:hypothetical protein
MTPDQMFSIANAVAALSWILLAGLGWKRWVSATVTGIAIPLLLGAVYLALIIGHWGERSGDFSSLAGVAHLFENRWLLLAGWVHYLAFDLFVGSWEVRDAAERGIRHWIVIPCLFFTFMFGPVGLLLYFAVRTSIRSQNNAPVGTLAK